MTASNQTQQTPTPWKAVTPCPGECCWHVVPASFDETDLKRDNWHELINLPEMSEADAKLIVRAVNNHDALLSALTRLLASAPEISGATEDDLCLAANEPGDAELNEQAAAVLQARAALAKAGVTP